MKQNRKTIRNKLKGSYGKETMKFYRFLARLKKKKSSLLKLEMKQEIF